MVQYLHHYIKSMLTPGVSHLIYANRAAPSCNIGTCFTVLSHLRFLCGGGTTCQSQRYIAACTYPVYRYFIHIILSYVAVCFRSAGQGLVELFQSDPVQALFNGVTTQDMHPEKAIYKPSVPKR